MVRSTCICIQLPPTGQTLPLLFHRPHTNSHFLSIQTPPDRNAVSFSCSTTQHPFTLLVPCADSSLSHLLTKRTRCIVVKFTSRSSFLQRISCYFMHSVAMLAQVLRSTGEAIARRSGDGGLGLCAVAVWCKPFLTPSLVQVFVTRHSCPIGGVHPKARHTTVTHGGRMMQTAEPMTNGKTIGGCATFAGRGPRNLSKNADLAQSAQRGAHQGNLLCSKTQTYTLVVAVTRTWPWMHQRDASLGLTRHTLRVVEVCLQSCAKFRERPKVENRHSRDARVF